MAVSSLRNQKGFTLIELLAVMAIVATLAGIVATQVSGSGNTSRDVQTQQDATTVSTAVADFFSDQKGATILSSSTVTVFGEVGIKISTDSKWPEIPLTSGSAYRNVFQETRSEIGALSLFDQEGNPSVLSVRGLLENYNAVDFFALIDGGYLQALPDGADQFSKIFSNYLWLLKKETAASSGGTVASREVEVFKLLTIQKVEDLDLDVLAYLRLVGQTIVNETPVADPVDLKTGASTPVEIVLTGSDPDGDPLTFIVITQPEFGSVSSVSGTPPQVTYTPIGIGGNDSFAFKAYDGISDSEPALVSIQLLGGSPPPSGETDPGDTFTDTNPANHIDDVLDVLIEAGATAPEDVIVLFTEEHLSSAFSLLTQTFDLVAVSHLVGDPIGVSAGMVVRGVLGPPSNTVSTTLTPDQIDALALFSEVIHIEKDRTTLPLE